MAQSRCFIEMRAAIWLRLISIFTSPSISMQRWRWENRFFFIFIDTSTAAAAALQMPHSRNPNAISVFVNTENVVRCFLSLARISPINLIPDERKCSGRIETKNQQDYRKIEMQITTEAG